MQADNLPENELKIIATPLGYMLIDAEQNVLRIGMADIFGSRADVESEVTERKEMQPELWFGGMERWDRVEA